MNKEQNIQEQSDKNENILSSISHKMLYEVPEGYFQDFVERMAKLAIGNNDKQTIDYNSSLKFHLPIGYFEGLPIEIESRVTTDNISASTSSVMPYYVPTNYFNEFSDKLKLSGDNKSLGSKKIIPFYLKKIRIAVAAVLVLSLGFSIIGILNNKAPEKMLKSVSKSDLNEYMQQYGIDAEAGATDVGFESAALNFDPNEIAQYLNETGWND